MLDSSSDLADSTTDSFIGHIHFGAAQQCAELLCNYLKYIGQLGCACLFKSMQLRGQKSNAMTNRLEQIRWIIFFSCFVSTKDSPGVLHIALIQGDWNHRWPWETLVWRMSAGWTQSRVCKCKWNRIFIAHLTVAPFLLELSHLGQRSHRLLTSVFRIRLPFLRFLDHLLQNWVWR